MIKGSMDIALFEMYLDNQHLAPRTIRSYVRVITQFLKGTPDVLDPNSYMDFLIATAVKKRNPANLYAILKFINFKISDEILRNKIKKKIKLLNIKQKPSVHYIDKKPLTENELSRVLSKLEHHKHYVISLIMFQTGMRIGDILNVLKDAIYYESEQDVPVMKLSYLGKGGKRTTKWVYDMNVAKVIEDYMKQHITDTDYIFVDRAGRRNNLMRNPKQVTQAQDSNRFYYWEDLKQALRAADVDPSRFAAHSFRRDYARRVWNWSHNIDSLKKMLGHADARTTMVYLEQQGYQTEQISKDFYLSTK